VTPSTTSEGMQLELVLRRAFHRAGIVESWLHKCRRQAAATSKPRRMIGSTAVRAAR
jgi:hypothetical protein